MYLACLNFPGDYTNMKYMQRVKIT